MDAGYWQIETEEASRDRLAFFVPNGKLQWTVMPMGALNAHAVLVAMMAVLQEEWLASATKAGLKQCGSQVIVDDILLWAASVHVLLEFFAIVLDVLQKYRATLKLKKSQLITPRCEFVGIDLVPGGRSPAQTIFRAFREIPAPALFADLRMLIGMFGFYQTWLQNYEVRISPWRKLQSLQPKPGSLSISDEAEILSAHWDNSCHELLSELKEEILSGPVLARPDPN